MWWESTHSSNSRDGVCAAATKTMDRDSLVGRATGKGSSTSAVWELYEIEKGKETTTHPHRRLPANRTRTGSSQPAWSGTPNPPLVRILSFMIPPTAARPPACHPPAPPTSPPRQRPYASVAGASNKIWSMIEASSSAASAPSIRYLSAPSRTKHNVGRPRMARADASSGSDSVSTLRMRRRPS